MPKIKICRYSKDCLPGLAQRRQILPPIFLTAPVFSAFQQAAIFAARQHLPAVLSHERGRRARCAANALRPCARPDILHGDMQSAKHREICHVKKSACNSRKAAARHQAGKARRQKEGRKPNDPIRKDLQTLGFCFAAFSNAAPGDEREQVKEKRQKLPGGRTYGRTPAGTIRLVKE